LWFEARLPEKSRTDPRPQGERWKEIQGETAALVDWLARVPRGTMKSVERVASAYAQIAGPFAAWMSFYERLLANEEDARTRSTALWTFGQVAFRMGELDRALEAAREKSELDTAVGRRRDAAHAAGLRADILQLRGQLDEALRIRNDVALPVYEKLG